MVLTERKVVQDGYDKIAERYLEWTSTTESPRLRYIEEVLSKLPSTESARVLELACGAGVPVTKKLLEHGCSVIGNDISEKQLQLAKERCPSATLIGGDMTLLQFEDSTFDAVVCLFALFHLPRTEQPALLTKVLRWLRPGGFLLVNLGTDDNEGGNGNFHGAEMFYSGYDGDRNKNMIKEVGFEVISAEILDGSDGSDPTDPDYGIKFLWVVARKGS